MTKQQALALRPGQIIYHVTGRNADGTSTRAKVNGQPRTPVRKPEEWRVPLKHGFRNTFDLNSFNVNDWRLTPQPPITK